MALELAFRESGSGAPLLILHGLFGSGSNWGRVARELSARRRVIAVDLRNHGDSPWSETMDYTEMADDVMRLVDHLGLRQADVLGHSMGGKVAMALALAHPQAVRRLLVADIAPVAYASRLSLTVEAMRGIDMLVNASRAEVARRLAEQLPEPALAPFLMQNLVTRNSHLDWRVNLAAISAALPLLSDFPAALRCLSFRGSVHVIAGGRSDYVKQTDGSEFHPMFSPAGVHVLESAGHWLHADAPERFITWASRVLETA